MSKQLDELFEKYAYNTQQKNQLRIADEKGLDLDKIKNPELDWEQMREISLAMEYGVDPTPLLDPSIPSENMEEIRTHIFEKQGIFEQQKELVARKRLKRLQISALSSVLVFVTICLCFWKKDLIMSFFDDLQLNLIGEEVKVGLSELNTIQYSSYVQNYDHNKELILPTNEIKGIGKYDLVYELKSESKSVKKHLLLEVYDDIAPVLTLKKSNITIENGSSFNAKDYIDKVNDNIDKLSKDDVVINSKVNTNAAGTYDVVYSLLDLSKNKTEAKLKVTVKEKASSNSNSNGSISSGGSGNTTKPSEGNSSSIEKNTPDTKIFRIKDYNYDIGKCKAAAVAYMNSIVQSGQYNVTMGSLDQYIEGGSVVGYKVIFK